jgi:Insertion element 4 transposase N-terminal/Transposase DDE domain
MGYRIRQIEPETKFTELMGIETLTRIIPMETIHTLLKEYGVQGQRDRRLPGWLTVLFCIGMNLLSELSMTGVMEHLMRGTRLIHDADEEEAPSAGAYSQARARLGAKVMERLFKVVCRPLASPTTRGAFTYGLRLVALDGSVDEVPDSQANSAYFGRASAARGESAFPQVQCVYLCECGTHAIFDAAFWPYAVSERRGGKRLLRSVRADRLVMWDRGFHDYDMLAGVRARGAHVLARLPAHVKPELVEVLPDGTYLAYIHPSDPKRRGTQRLLVRVLEYTLDDPTRPGHGQPHRLITTLLDPAAYPALDLIVLYHERWEVDLTLDELKVHQRLLPRPLRSLKPVGVIQELYALLLAHFVVRCIMHEAAVAFRLDPDRLSFVESLRLIQAAIPEFQWVDPSLHDRLWRRLLRDIVRHILPLRRNRTQPRVVKRKMSNFKLKRPEHRAVPQPTQPFAEVVVVLPMPLPVLI